MHEVRGAIFTSRVNKIKEDILKNQDVLNLNHSGPCSVATGMFHRMKHADVQVSAIQWLTIKILTPCIVLGCKQSGLAAAQSYSQGLF